MLTLKEVIALPVPLLHRRYLLPYLLQGIPFLGHEDVGSEGLYLPNRRGTCPIVDDQGVSCPGHCHIQVVYLVPYHGMVSRIEDVFRLDLPPDIGRFGIGGEFPQKYGIELQPFRLMDGEYKLGAQCVHKCSGGVRLADGTLAGSSLTMNLAFKNLFSIGINSIEISKRLSLIPNQLIQSQNRGEIKVGNFSDFVLMDKDFNIIKVITEGETCGI